MVQEWNAPEDATCSSQIHQVVDNIRGLHIHKMIGYIEKPLIQKQGLPQISSCNGKHNTHIEAIFFHCRPVLWAGGDNPFEAIFF